VSQAPDGRGQSAAERDRQMIARLAAGDAAALGPIYDWYGRACYSLARRILGDEVLAEDVVQDVFLSLWRDARRYDERRGGFGGYLMSVTHHKAVDAVRREENQRRRRAPAELLDDQRDDAADVPATVWQGVRGDRVREALGGLPVEQREPLLLAYFGGYTQREIAGLTSTPLGTVKTRMLTGMRRMRRALESSLADPGFSGGSGVGS
jgi:RNA polymerase sigma factor (sigma-70 family)